MSQKTDVELTTEADVIANETVSGANTKTRVANILKNITDSKRNNVTLDAELLALTNALTSKESTANKDVSGGYVGLTLLKLNIRNTLNTVLSFLISDATVPRNWQLQDRDGILADLTDVNVVSRTAITGAVTLDDTAFGKVHTLTDSGGVADYTVTLPAPSAGNLNKTIFFKGLTTLTKVVTLSKAAVTIAGETNWKLSKSGIVGLLSDGTNYIVIAEVGSWIPFIPVWTGFSVDPTSVVARYFRIGRRCTYQVAGGTGTSAASTPGTLLTVSAPFAAKVGTQAIIRALNNTTWTAGLMITDGSTALSAYSTPAGGAWSSSVSKTIDFCIDFEIV